MPKLLLIRHGVTASNSARQFAGHTDVELSVEGRAQVEKLSHRLTNEKIDAIYSSDLKRAVTTAEIVASGHQLNIITCPELKEINYGRIEGLSIAEIGPLFPDVAKLIANFTPDLEFPGGETFMTFFERVGKFLDRLKQHTPEQTVAITAHSGPLRALICSLLGLGPEHWGRMRLDNASLSIIETQPNRAVLTLLNDTSHLRAKC
ncbi:MAG: histidine phosphatase family protein [Chloroflexota bacterium]